MRRMSAAIKHVRVMITSATRFTLLTRYFWTCVPCSLRTTTTMSSCEGFTQLGEDSLFSEGNWSTVDRYAANERDVRRLYPETVHDLWEDVPFP